MVIHEHKSKSAEGSSKGGRRQRRSEENRIGILQAAARLFMQHGFSNVTVEQITEAADVGKGTFFNYFPTKEHVLVAMVRQRTDLVAMAAREAQAATTVKPVALRLAMNMAQANASSPSMVRDLLGSACTNEVMLKHMQGVLLAARSAAAEIMRRGQELGEVRRDIPYTELGRMMQSAAFGTVVLWSLQPEPTDLETWLTQSMENFWRGIAASAAAPKSSKETTTEQKKS